jgi:hypothetical protein
LRGTYAKEGNLVDLKPVSIVSIGTWNFYNQRNELLTGLLFSLHLAPLSGSTMWGSLSSTAARYLCSGVGMPIFIKILTSNGFWLTNSRKFVLSSVPRNEVVKMRKLVGVKLGEKAYKNHFLLRLAKITT